MEVEGIVQFLIGIGIALLIGGFIYFYVWPLLIGEDERRTIYDALLENLGRLRDGQQLTVVGVMPEELGTVVGFSSSQQFLDFGAPETIALRGNTYWDGWSTSCPGIPIANKIQKPCTGSCLCYCSRPVANLDPNITLVDWCEGTLTCKDISLDFVGSYGPSCDIAAVSWWAAYGQNLALTSDRFVGVVMRREGEVVTFMPPAAS